MEEGLFFFWQIRDQGPALRWDSLIRGDFQVLTQFIEGFVVDDFAHVPGSAVRTKAIRWVSKHHGHTKRKTTRA